MAEAVGRPRVRASRALFGVLLAISACALASSQRDWRWVVTGEPALRDLVQVGAFADPRLREASGSVPSEREPGVFWSQNDSGNDAVLFAYDSAGTSRGSVIVTGAKNTDWEAVAPGPCPAGRCLYIGDVGDNFAVRRSVSVLRVPAPITSDSRTEAAQRLRVRYAGGATDVEAMWVAPDSSIWFATKRPASGSAGRARPSRLYRVSSPDWSGDRTARAELVDSLPIVPVRSTVRDWVTDAALSPAGADGRRRLAVLTYGSVYVFDADPNTGRPGAQLARCAVPLWEAQTEGISWLPDGRLLLVNEGRGGRLYAGRCP